MLFEQIVSPRCKRGLVKEEDEKEKKCFCNKNFTVDEIKQMVKLLKGKELIWENNACTIEDKSFEAFSNQLNAMMSKYSINTCIRKIHFLAQAIHESASLSTTEELPSKYASSKSIYKGRGIIQLTGSRDKGSEYYNLPGSYEAYANYIKKPEIKITPSIVASDIFYCVDSAGWEWSVEKKAPKHHFRSDIEKGILNKTPECKNYKEEIANKSLNEIADFEDKYLFTISILLNGFDPEIGEPNNWKERLKLYELLRDKFFKYNELCEASSEKKSKKRAPWMKLAWLEEAKKLKETGSNNEIQKYFKDTAYEKPMKDNTKNEKDIAWCAAFVNWIMRHYGYEGVKTDQGYDAVRALKWATWPEGRDLGKPVYGAIAVKKRPGGGHVGFVAGKKGNGIVILGGNQSQKLCCVSYEVSDYFAYIVPTNYSVTEEDYNLPEYKGNPGVKGTEL